ncbi:kinase [Fictibacillus fluitans]|uniref:Kinase n=1 Tax=Fictibacillus fluitans TaxID=3058422 RepID=A0ABT8HTJ3_9BACL|nr:kinase [Fictibacillus sp. NE201]MDN4524099.1 kinase [Fictibacillus sp. NE201]
MQNLIVQSGQKKLAEGLQYGQGSAFGTFGELLQGVRNDNDKDFLVTLPIAKFSHAAFTCIPTVDSLAIYPSNKLKSLNLANNILRHYNLPAGGHLYIHSNLPIGKGFASSSADLVAVIRAISDCFQIHIPLETAQSFLAEIEPTDGVMYEGVVSFYHREVELCKFIGQLPPLSIVGIDEGGIVDTVEFNRIPKNFSSVDKVYYEELLKDLTIAIESGNEEAIGRVSTISAMMHQKIRPKRTLNHVLAICEEVKGLGIAIAHSGTCIGILLSNSDYQFHQKLAAAREKLSKHSKEVMVYHSWNTSSCQGHVHIREPIMGRSY